MAVAVRASHQFCSPTCDQALCDPTDKGGVVGEKCRQPFDDECGVRARRLAEMVGDHCEQGDSVGIRRQSFDKSKTSNMAIHTAAPPPSSRRVSRPAAIDRRSTSGHRWAAVKAASARASSSARSGGSTSSRRGRS